MKKYLFIILLSFSFGLTEVDASSGQLKKDSIKSCNGVIYGQHTDHWHVAKKSGNRYYATGSAIYENPCTSASVNKNEEKIEQENTKEETTNNTKNENPTQNSNSSNKNNVSSNKNEPSPLKQEIKKNNDNTIKTIIIDDKEFNNLDNVVYKTTKEDINITAITNNELATYKVKNNSKLSIGNNKIIIEVKAEDGSIKNYTINVIREKKLSPDTGINITINNEKVHFENNKASINIDSSINNVNFDYTLSNKNAKVEIDKITKLKDGDNLINIKVIAEDNSEQIYEINIYKNSKFEESIYSSLTYGIIGSSFYCFYQIIKKLKAKRR